MEVIFALMMLVGMALVTSWIAAYLRGAPMTFWQHSDHDADVDVEVWRKPGRKFYGWRAECSVCGWSGGSQFSAQSPGFTRRLALKSHGDRDGTTIRYTRPCPVCDAPSKVGSVTCGTERCDGALAEVRRIAGEPLT